MREEVEALLTADAGNDNFLTSPAYEFAAGMFASEAAEFAAGQTVGRYEILWSLGEGGMGQIYLARDAQLGRNIALKLISQEFATDAKRVLRFEQEARAASALNHPNVCVIHEIGITDQGRHFIAMEYIQGTTLREHLARGPLKPIEALQVAIQVGAALASAHAVGIIHRDIKPENIMLRPDGYVKVVDFGLAKLTEVLPEHQRSGDAPTVVRTEPRTLMGTVKYMSPEQLREAAVDERTDIWSLGVVLYEMLNGSTPFEGESRNDSVAAILKLEPAQLTFPEAVPLRYREIVRKALEKDCNERYQATNRLISDLSSLKRELERNADGDIASDASMQSMPVSYIPVQSQPTARLGSAIFARFKSQAILTADSLFSEVRTHKTAAIFAGTSFVFILLLFWSTGLVNPFKNPATALDMKRLTYTGKSVRSAISFDGKWLAHAEELKGKQQLVVTNLATSAPIVAVPPANVRYVGITFSRDGNYLYYTSKEMSGPGILYRLALPGSNPVKITTGVDSPISFSPQGDRFAFVRHDEKTSEYFLMLANVDGTNEHPLASRKNGERFSVDGPAWSPDGSMVVCPAGYWDENFHTNLIGFDVQNGREQLIGNGPWFQIFQVAWQDMSNLIISARDRETAPYRLWRISFPDGAARKITADPANYDGVSLTGDKIVTIRTNISWKISIATLDEPQKMNEITSGVGVNYGLSWTSQGKIVFSSMAQDRLNISRIDLDGTNQVQLTASGDNYAPAASADGRFIVFASNRNGTNIWRINVDDGSDATQLTFTDGNYYPSVSPDNQWVAYDNVRHANATILKVSLNGGEPVKVAERCRMPVFSPDNQFIMCRSNMESSSRDVAIFSAQGGEPLRRIPIPIQEFQRPQWLPGGHELSYVNIVDGYPNIWSFDLNSGTTKQLTNFNSDRIYAYAWSPDYKQIACQLGTNISEVTIISER